MPEWKPGYRVYHGRHSRNPGRENGTRYWNYLTHSWQVLGTPPPREDSGPDHDSGSEPHTPEEGLANQRKMSPPREGARPIESKRSQSPASDSPPEDIGPSHGNASHPPDTSPDLEEDVSTDDDIDTETSTSQEEVRTARYHKHQSHGEKHRDTRDRMVHQQQRQDDPQDPDNTPSNSDSERANDVGLKKSKHSLGKKKSTQRGTS